MDPSCHDRPDSLHLEKRSESDQEVHDSLVSGCMFNLHFAHARSDVSMYEDVPSTIPSFHLPSIIIATRTQPIILFK